MTSFDFSALSNITFINIMGSYNISSISSISGLSNLTDFRIAGNSLYDISPLSGLTNLTDLTINNGHIPDLSDLAGLTNLTHANLYDCETTDISDLTTLTSLMNLDIRNSNISVLPVSLPTWGGAPGWQPFYLSNSGLDSTEVDSLLNMFYNAGSSYLTIYLDGTNGSRTSASDTAVDWLRSTGNAEVNVNETPTTITDVDTDETITASQTNVVLTGTGFRGFVHLAQGFGHLRL